MDPKGLLTSGADLAQLRKVSTAAKCGLEIVCSVAVARMREHCQKKNCICRKGHVGRDKCPNLVSMVEARKDLRPTAEKIKTDLEKLVSQTQTLHHSSLQGEVNTSKCASRFQDKIISQELYRETLCSQIKMTEIVPQYSHPWFLFSLSRISLWVSRYQKFLHNNLTTLQQASFSNRHTPLELTQEIILLIHSGHKINKWWYLRVGVGFWGWW